MNRAISICKKVTCALFIAAACITSTFSQTGDSLKRASDTARYSILQKRYNVTDSRLPFTPVRKQPLLFLETPPNITPSVEYDPKNNEYNFSEKVGQLNYSTPYSMNLNEYKNYEFKRSKQENWRQRSKSESVDRRSPLMKSINIGGEAFDKIFGTNTINIVPQGSAELIFGISTSKVNNPNISERLRKTTTFDFREKIQMNVTGSIGDKMKLGVNYNTEATFDFENKTKLEYTGKEDEIIKKIEAGNVSLPLTGSLITGSQSLFGLKTEMQFGKLYMTTVLSQQKGESSVIEVKGGSQQEEFSITADQYDANKHFFLSQYFRNNYEAALEHLPTITSSITITKIEVWVTNKSSSYENARNVVAFMDLGEHNVWNRVTEFQPSGSSPYPSNTANGLYNAVLNSYAARDIKDVYNKLSPLSAQGFYSGQDYEKLENARRLNDREYTLNEKLGYISLNSALNSDEVLAVAYEYVMGGKTYRVGELSTSGVETPNALVVKLIKATNLTPKLPTWDLMMKNVYALGAYQVSRENFQLNVLYQDDKTGNAINYIPEDKTKTEILIQALNMDHLNSQGDPVPDGVFDYIEGTTINPSNGRVFFTTLEPFGRTLDNNLKKNGITDSLARRKYVFWELYDSTQTKARLEAERNKFKIAGKYQSSSSSEISLNATNINQGSVVVTAGGAKLIENQDYTVDYTIGRVKIINQGLLESGTPIKISLENNSLFNIQTKTLIGTHLDYKFSDNFILGGTILHLSERPLTQKVNIGDEPISNTIWGINGTYTTKSQFLTTLIDKLPFIQTKEPSTLTFEGEFAHLIPGHNKIIKKAGTAYIDDFEGSETSYEMKTFTAWSLASTPQGQDDLFPEMSNYGDNARRTGYNRAKLSWYVIDPLFLRNTSATPGHIKNNDLEQKNPFTREVNEEEIFTNKYNPSNLPSNIQLLNLAYYPWERGPYNYDSNLDPTGKLKNPKSRWGGIQREVLTNDFEAANVQFIEFWMMDPYVLDSASSNQGKLYFNLGNVSEDVLKDSRKSFENGLPTSAEVTGVDTTTWGRVPSITNQSLVNAFDNNSSSRQYQDIGLDGLNDDDEKLFFKSFIDSIRAKVTDQTALDKIIQDPSNDDFHYYRGSDYDKENLGILERYKRYNGYENNSPALVANEETSSGTTLPNSEDINRDNTINEGENYYQYSVNISPQSLAEVGKNYITDIVPGKSYNYNGKPIRVRWLQFRIPITEPEKTIGGIQDFKSIRFMRMFMKGFQDSVILRFAKLELVRGEWRKYNLSMRQGTEGVSIPEENDGAFEISSVNIEENGQKSPIPYVLPPGIDRVIDPQNPQLTPLNEQSMVLKVTDLVNGDARAAYKTMDLDVRQYKKLQMEVHAEEIPGSKLKDKELTLFIRMGSDYRNNYYEVEIPLKPTDATNSANDYTTDEGRALVWPADNRIDFAFEDLQRVKQARNQTMGSGSNVNYSTVFQYKIDGSPYNYYICGNPNLSNVRTIMIGVRYPSAEGEQGQTRSAEVWVNELRLTDFNEKGGWAANARVIAKLADLGTVSIAGSTLKPGFGSIDQKVNERSKEEINTYDISSNLELGKFFPEKSGVSIPMYVGYSESFTNPEYNPIDPDIPLKAALDNAGTDAERRQILRKARDYVMRRSLNFTNVRINKTQGKPHFYDISNWSVNYAFNETYSHNITTQKSIDKRYHGGIMYNYNGQPTNIQPFQKVKFLNNKNLRLIRDFNFNLGFTSLGFRTEMTRNYRETLLRDIDNEKNLVMPTVSKDFLWNRYYEFSYDLTRSIKIDFTASNMARIDEPITKDGVVNKYMRDDYEAWKDTVWQNIKNFGRTTQYFHDINISYNLPINKFPMLDWTSANLRYGASYGWDAAPLDSISQQLGNTIKNSNTLQFSSQLNFSTLYNKVPYFKKLLQVKNNKSPQNKKTKKVTFEKTNMVLRAGEARTVFHKLATDQVNVKFYDSNSKEMKGKTEIVSDNKISFTPDSSDNNARVWIEGTIEVKPNPLVIILETSTKLLLGIKNVSFTYSQTEGTLLPGFKPYSQILGMERTNGMLAPGLPFIFGFQDRNFAEKAAARYGWLSNSINQNSPFLMTHNETFNGRINFEPFPGFKVELTTLRTYTRNESSYYIAASDGSYPDSTRSYTRNGNFSMSIISIGSAFEKVTSKNYRNSATFEKFKKYRYDIIKRLAENRKQEDPANYNPGIDINGNIIQDTRIKNGYNEFSQQALIPAFLAAYGGTNPKKVTLASIPSYLNMRPNWRVTFDGLSKLDFVKKFAKSVNLNHSYKSTYNVGSYLTNPDFYEDGFFNVETGLSLARDLQNNFLGPVDINSVSITEQFSPLINVDISWKSSLLTRLEIRRSRNIILSTSSYQITETTNNDLVIGTGYKFKDVQFILKSADGQKAIKSDLNLTADVSIRDNKVVVRRLVGVPQAAQGQNVVTIKVAADYNLSESFNLRLYYDRIVTNPFISSFPTSNTNIGFSVRFTLVQ